MFKTNTFFTGGEQAQMPSSRAQFLEALPETQQAANRGAFAYKIKSDYHHFVRMKVLRCVEMNELLSTKVDAVKGITNVVVNDKHPCMVSFKKHDTLCGKMSIAFSYGGYRRATPADMFVPLFERFPKGA